MLSSTIYAAPASDELTADVTFIMPKPTKKRRKRRKRCATTVPTISSTTSTGTRETDKTLSVATVSSSTSPCKSIATRRRTTNKVRRYFQHDTREIVKTTTESALNYAAVAKKFKPLTIARNRNQAKKQKQNASKQQWHKQQLKITKRQEQKPKMLSKYMGKSSPHFCSISAANTTHSHCKCACAFPTAATSHAKYKQQKCNNCDSITIDNKTNLMQQQQQQAAVVESAIIVEELLRKLLNAQQNNANGVTSQSPMLNLLQNSGLTSVSAPRISLLDTLIGERFQQTTSLCQQQLRHVVRYILTYLHTHLHIIHM